MAEGGRVKICGLCRPEDARQADEAGADYLGAVLSAGFSRSVPAGRIAGLMEGVRAVPVAVLVDEEPEEARRLARALGAGVVQLHGDETPEVARAVAEAGPWSVWKAVRLRAPGELEEAVERFAAVVDGLLLEGWKEGIVGGGGVRLRDGLARGAKGVMPEGLDFVLAGGLTADSVFDAVARHRPDVVDVSSGVERALCLKDPEAVARFVREARRGWRAPDRPSTDPASGATP